MMRRHSRKPIRYMSKSQHGSVSSNPASIYAYTVHKQNTNNIHNFASGGPLGKILRNQISADLTPAITQR